jgi:hypothetical protein
MRLPSLIASATALTLTLALAAAPAATAATTFQDQEERLELVYAYLADLRPGGAPIPLSATAAPLDVAADLELEAGLVPDVDSRVGAKDEDVKPPPVLFRPRARILLGIGVFVGASYTPPIATWRGFREEVFGLEGGFRTGFATDWAFAQIRGSYTRAHVTGPVTASDARDIFTTQNRAADLTFGARLFEHVAPWAGVGYGHVDARLLVTNDGTRLPARSDYPYGIIGLDVLVGPVTIGIEQDFSEDFLQHLWLSIGVRF